MKIEKLNESRLGNIIEQEAIEAGYSKTEAAKFGDTVDNDPESYDEIKKAIDSAKEKAEAEKQAKSEEEKARREAEKEKALEDAKNTLNDIRNNSEKSDSGLEKDFFQELNNSVEQAEAGKKFLIQNAKFPQELVDKIYSKDKSGNGPTGKGLYMNTELFCEWIKHMKFAELKNPENKFVQALKIPFEKKWTNQTLLDSQKSFFELYNSYARDSLSDAKPEYLANPNSVIYDRDLYDLDSDDIDDYIELDIISDEKGLRDDLGKSLILYDKDGKLKDTVSVEKATKEVEDKLKLKDNSKDYLSQKRITNMSPKEIEDVLDSIPDRKDSKKYLDILGNTLKEIQNGTQAYPS